MNFTSLVLISIGLAMDAFAVSLTEGLAMKRLHIRHTLRVAVIFGLFQAVMPFIGWRVGGLFSERISQYDHLVTFALLLFVGGKMIFDAWEDHKCETTGRCELSSNVLMLGFATSIDALAIGFSFSLVPNLNILYSIGIIGVITFFISSAGVYLGYRVGHLINYKTEYLGGAILILMGFKSLMENFI